MKSLSMSRHSARVVTTVSQGVALLLAAGAVAAIVIPGSTSDPLVALRTDSSVETPTIVQTDAGAPAFRDFASIGDMLSMYDKPVAAEPAKTPTQPTQTARPAEPPLRYLGPVTMPGRTSAILALDGEQRILRPGGMIRDYRVEAVTDEYVEVSRNGRVTRVARIRPGDVQISMLSAIPGGVGTALNAGVDPRRGRTIDPSVAHMGEDAMADGTSMTRVDPNLNTTTTLPGARRATPAEIKMREEMEAKYRLEAEGVGIIGGADGDDVKSKGDPDSAGAADS